MVACPFDSLEAGQQTSISRKPNLDTTDCEMRAYD